MKEVYHAEKPTAGQPYAFPDPEMSDINRSSGSVEPNGSKLSRRNSDHTSITSSIITNDSKLPPGQHRLDEGEKALTLTTKDGCTNYDNYRSHAGHPSSLASAQAS